MRGDVMEVKELSSGFADSQTGSERRSRVVCIIPTLNEQPSIGSVISRAKKYVDEIIVVDGKSEDGTVAEALKNGVSIMIQRGFGKGAAIRQAFNVVDADFVIMMDGDGSMDPEEIPSFLEKLSSGADMVRGSRFLQGGGTSDLTLVRKFGNRVFLFLTNALFSTRFTDLCYGFKAFKATALHRLNVDLKANGFEIETEISIKAAKAKLDIQEVPSYEHKRKHGESHLNAVRDGWHILRVIIKEYVSALKGLV